MAKKLHFEKFQVKSVKKSIYTLGIDVGGTKISSCIGSLNNGEILIENYEYIFSEGGENVINQIIESIYKLVPQSFIEKKLIKGIGIGIPGIVGNNGEVIWAPNIKNWKNVPLAERVFKEISIPVYLKNDVDCAALGEYYFGSAKGYKNVVFIAIGTGIGCGIIVNGEIYSGSHNVAGAIGWSILGKEGMKYSYKNCGHLEEVSSGSALDRIGKQVFGKDASSKTVFELYRKKNKKAIQIINEMLLYLGMCISNIISFFDPEIVVIGGGVGENKDIIIPAVTNIIKKYSQPYIAKKVKVLPSLLGTKAGLYGAMWLPVIYSKSKKHNFLCNYLTKKF